MERSDAFLQPGRSDAVFQPASPDAPSENARAPEGEPGGIRREGEPGGLEPAPGAWGELGPEALAPGLGAVEEALHVARDANPRADRVLALLTLGRSGDRRALAALEALCADPDWVVRKYAVSGLGLLALPPSRPVLVGRLDDGEREVRRAAWRALKRLDETAALDDERRALWLAGSEEADWGVRSLALEVLAADLAHPRVRARFLGALRDPAWLVRYRAAQGLARVQGPYVRAALLAALRDDAKLAPHCALALAAQGPAVLPDLLALLPAAPPWRQLAIARALGALDDERARAALAALLGHPDREVDQAILAHGPAMHAHLQRALAEPDWVVRWHAAHLLGDSRAPDAAIPLLPLLADRRPEVRLAVLDSLKALADPRGEPDLLLTADDASWHIRLATIEALAALPSETARARIVDALDDARGEVRLAARRALRAQGPEAERALLEGMTRLPRRTEEIAWLLKAQRGSVVS